MQRKRIRKSKTKKTKTNIQTKKKVIHDDDRAKGPPKKLLIVESPTKARTIKFYLGHEFDVIASKGHIKDLPEGRLGVDIKNDFKPEIVILPGKREVVKEIQEKSLNSSEIYLGSDPDREGEAIAQHIKEEIEKKSKNKPIKRALFYEITKEEVENAITNSGDIDKNKVEAQKARRILDRLVGYMVSPLLWKTVQRGLSAGRVQTVALRLVCEREKERLGFKKEKFFVVKILVASDSVKFWATLKSDKPLTKKKEVENILTELKNQDALVTSFNKKMLKIKPYPPLKTSTLQQEASKRYRFSPGKTMTIAQKLYEGVQIDGKNTGLITYMRTDSLRLSEKAISALRNQIKNLYGSQYIPHTPINHEKGGRLVQGAHEAIRPTKPEVSPETLTDKLERDHLRLYELIWKRAMGSQGNYAEEEAKEATLHVSNYNFVARGKKLLFDGFYKIIGEVPQYEDIPELKEGETLKIIDATYEAKETEPPPRYTEASLIRTMEHLGIGRPSTYAPTLETLYERRYITKEKGYLLPTELGMQVSDILIPRFKDIFEVKFTAKMETSLDEIENGRKTSIEVLREFYREFEKDLEIFKGSITEIKQNLEKTEEICPVCGAPLLLKWSKYGKFYACSRFPDCKYTRPADAIVFEDKKCALCGKPMMLVLGKKGRYFRCSDYPLCKGTMPYSIGVKCPECGGEIIERKNSKNNKVFYACSNYPQCKFVSSSMPVAIPCNKCNYPIMVEKKIGKTVYLVCPKCKNKYKEEKHEEDPGL
ncbi:MAG TPA: type I DNA topoisomerase [Candidatus Hydrothermia bacterium]|nr:type I DNA topoisomerase [Candidatus Hydrothermia bacterium]